MVSWVPDYFYRGQLASAPMTTDDPVSAQKRPHRKQLCVMGGWSETSHYGRLIISALWVLIGHLPPPLHLHWWGIRFPIVIRRTHALHTQCTPLAEKLSLTLGWLALGGRAAWMPGWCVCMCVKEWGRCLAGFCLLGGLGHIAQHDPLQLSWLLCEELIVKFQFPGKCFCSSWKVCYANILLVSAPDWYQSSLTLDMKTKTEILN